MTTQNILITGISGQDGIFLANHFLSDNHNKYKVYGISRQDPILTINKLKSLNPLNNNLKILNIDLTEPSIVLKFILDIQPDQVFNLSGPSSVYDSITNNVYYEKTIISIFNNLTKACLKLKKLPNYFQACSSEMYSDKNLMPLSEKSEFDPRSPYAKAKYEVFKKVNDLKKIYDWNIKSGIMFNHESEFRDKNYLFPKIFSSANLIKAGKLDYLEVGSFEVHRDWSFAGDIAKAMYLINKYDENFNFVIGSGNAVSIKELIEQVFSLFGIKSDGRVVENSSLLRLGDPKFIVSDPSLLKDKLKWKQTYSLEELIERIYKRVYLPYQ